MGFYGKSLKVTGVHPDLDSVIFGPYLVRPERGPDDFLFLEQNGIDEKWDVTRNEIRIEFLETITASNGDYNAWVIEDHKNVLKDIQSVKIVAGRTDADWDKSMIEWSNDTIIINYVRDGLGRSIFYGQMLTLRVEFDPYSGTNGSDKILGTSANDRLSAKGGKDIVYAKRGDDIVKGGVGADGLFGGSGDDRILGGIGNDELFGGLGSDTLKGNGGIDMLFGGGGADRLNGGPGRDVLKGGKGPDVFVFSAGGDRILDFSPDVAGEVLNLRASAGIRNFKDLKANHLEPKGGGTEIEDAFGKTVFLKAVTPQELSADDFLF
ncbi:hemolysin type calcium-binding protein [Aliiruegeria haliotis]|uniref:Hemolysin type calcium-binding protein n=2 Tax=Aliiruegeria haliotis TaxID=1280846 RepID=A0A2T0RYE6_9RHOB|nr:hemolysin type calcium-binding protein [Aliiruegeria haliotis]